MDCILDVIVHDRCIKLAFPGPLGALPPNCKFPLTFSFVGGTELFHVYFMDCKEAGSPRVATLCCSPFICWETRPCAWEINCLQLELGIKILATNQKMPEALRLVGENSTLSEVWARVGIYSPPCSLLCEILNASI